MPFVLKRRYPLSGAGGPLAGPTTRGDYARGLGAAAGTTAPRDRSRRQLPNPLESTRQAHEIHDPEKPIKPLVISDFAHSIVPPFTTYDLKTLEFE